MREKNLPSPKSSFVLKGPGTISHSKLFPNPTASSARNNSIFFPLLKFQ